MTKPNEIPDLEDRFTYHSPKPGQPTQYALIRDTAKHLAYLLAETCPPGWEHAIALTKLEECVFWANAAVARHGEPEIGGAEPNPKYNYGPDSPPEEPNASG